MRVRFGDCSLDSETRQLVVRGEEVHLQPKAFQFLELLLENRPKVVSKDAIHEQLWPGTFVSDGTVTSLLAEVRDAIGDDRARLGSSGPCTGSATPFPAKRRKSATRSPGRRPLKSAIWIVWGRQSIPIEAGESVIGRDPGRPSSSTTRAFPDDMRASSSSMAESPSRTSTARTAHSSPQGKWIHR